MCWDTSSNHILLTSPILMSMSSLTSWHHCHCDITAILTSLPLWRQFQHDITDIMTSLSLWHQCEHDINASMTSLPSWHHCHHDVIVKLLARSSFRDHLHPSKLFPPSHLVCRKSCFWSGDELCWNSWTFMKPWKTLGNGEKSGTGSTVVNTRESLI